MNLVYDKDNKERVPFEHYLEEYKTKDPLEISARTGFSYFQERSLFRYSFLERSTGFPFRIMRSGSWGRDIRRCFPRRLPEFW